MNILIWIVQIGLAVYNGIGGIYTISNHEQLKGALATDLPKSVWIAIGLLQILFSLGLVVPGAFGIFPKLTPIAAIYLAANALLGCVLFAKYTGFPGILWAVVPAILAVFVAYARWSAQ